MRPYREQAEYAWTEDSVRLVATPSFFAKSALFYVQEIGHFRTFASYFTERERLDSFLLVYTAGGKGRLTYRNKTHALHPGQVFFIDCMEYQFYASDPEDPWELSWVHMNGQSVRAYYDQFCLGCHPVRPQPPDTAIPSLLAELIELHRSKSMRNELLASKLLAELMTELLLSEPGFDSAYKETLPSYIAEILRFIEKRFSEKLTLDQLARQFAVNKYHLAKEFKKHTGFPPGELIINTRITRAKELLKYTDLPVSEIAEEVGIDNVSHFINLFRHRVEQTPLNFRKTWQTRK